MFALTFLASLYITRASVGLKDHVVGSSGSFLDVADSSSIPTGVIWKLYFPVELGK